MTYLHVVYVHMMYVHMIEYIEYIKYMRAKVFDDDFSQHLHHDLYSFNNQLGSVRIRERFV